VLFASPLFGGSVHDHTVLKKLFDPDLSWFKNLTVRLDLGFWGAKKDYRASAHIILPHKKPRKSKRNPAPKLTNKQRKENHQQAKTRVIVEQAIGGLKHFHCLTHRLRNQSTSLMNQLFLLSAGLWNFKIA